MPGRSLTFLIFPLFVPVDQPDPLSCFPELLRKQQYFSLLRGFCFASDGAKTGQPNSQGKFTSSQWEYHNFVVTIENGDRLYGHCLRFFDLQSHANATVAQQSRSTFISFHLVIFCCLNVLLLALSVPDSVLAVPRLRATPLLNCAMCVLSKFPLFDTYKKWLVHVCKEAYAPDSDADVGFSSIRIETRIINLITEMVAIRSNSVATKLSLTSTLTTSASRVSLAGKRTVDIAFRIPHRTKFFPPLDFNIRLLFASLDVHNVLVLLEGLLFGEQLLLLSSHISLLSLCCESLTSLLFPLTWPFSYVPVFSNDIPIDYVGGLVRNGFKLVQYGCPILITAPALLDAVPVRYFEIEPKSRRYPRPHSN